MRELLWPVVVSVTSGLVLLAASVAVGIVRDARREARHARADLAQHLDRIDRRIVLLGDRQAGIAGVVNALFSRTFPDAPVPTPERMQWDDEERD